MASEGGMSSRAAFPISHSCVDGGDHHSVSTKPAPGCASFTSDKLFSGDRDSRFFGNFHRPLPINQSWAPPRNGGSPVGGCGSDDDDDDGEDGHEEEEEEEDIEDGDGLVSLEEEGNQAANNSSGSVRSSSDRVRDGTADSQVPNSSFVLGNRGRGCSAGSLAKDVDGGRANSEEQQYRMCRMDGYADAVSIAQGQPYYRHGLRCCDVLSPAHKEVGMENGCSPSGRKEVGSTGRYWETLRNYLSDPITAVLMDDAMILSCGHSFGNGGMQHVYKLKACPSCSHPISEGSVRPNLALRAAVQAFLREEESQLFRPSKRQKERLEQDKCSYNDPCFMDISRGRAQFPFSVSDKVIIKGNKRTPQRFVGRMAVVTTQCLNGWFVVKTLDNAESVKLQYRSLAKVGDDHASNVISSEARTPHWL